MLNNILYLSKKFISIKSIKGNTKALNEILEISLSNLNEFTIEKFEKNGVKSALIYNSSKKPDKFKLLLNAHLDVIPGKDYQYLPKIKNGKLYGAGALDMKSNAACLILLFKEVAKMIKYPLALQLVTDEELGGFNGTKYQVEKGIGADFVIAGETTNFDIVSKAKGILWIKISSKGKAAHSAYPWKGENAINKMNKFLNLLNETFPIPNRQKWITTINLSNIKTNNQIFNKIPDTCEIWLDIRYISEDSNTIIDNIKKLLPQEFKLNIIVKEPSLFIDENNQYVIKLKKISELIIKNKIIIRGAQGSSDIRHFVHAGCSGIEFGPIGGGIGSDNEWINISSLGQYTQILKDFLLKL